jgi:hypothetical protein
MSAIFHFTQALLLAQTLRKSLAGRRIHAASMPPLPQVSAASRYDTISEWT